MEVGSRPNAGVGACTSEAIGTKEVREGGDMGCGGRGLVGGGRSGGTRLGFVDDSLTMRKYGLV